MNALKITITIVILAISIPAYSNAADLKESYEYWTPLNSTYSAPPEKMIDITGYYIGLNYIKNSIFLSDTDNKGIVSNKEYSNNTPSFNIGVFINNNSKINFRIYQTTIESGLYTLQNKFISISYDRTFNADTLQGPYFGIDFTQLTSETNKILYDPNSISWESGVSKPNFNLLITQNLYSLKLGYRHLFLGNHIVIDALVLLNISFGSSGYDSTKSNNSDYKFANNNLAVKITPSSTAFVTSINYRF